MTIREDHKKGPEDFTDPTELPRSTDQRQAWQAMNRSWWESHPMRYDWKEKVGYAEFSKEFYEEIDGRFFLNAREFMPWRSIPFDPLIDFDWLKDKDVLEIGVGSGSHAALLAGHAKTFTGIDLTEYAVRSTTQRLKAFDLAGTVLQQDAEKLEFENASFDFVWSWGVIHHSSDTRQVLREIARVLRPGGRAVIMVYHRSWWNYYLVGGLFHGILRGQLFRTGSLHKVVQGATDGALARYYSARDWRELVSEFFDVDRICVYGSKAELVPLPAGGLKRAVVRMLPAGLARFLTNTCRGGSFLVSALSRRR
jgi:SAM-dependent methyltransferase